MTDGKPRLADHLANTLAVKTWHARQALGPKPLCPADKAIHQIARSTEAPIIITDSADTVGAGAAGDNTSLLQALMAHGGGVDGLIVTHLPSPRAVAVLHQHHVGDTVTVAVGGEQDQRFCTPLTVSGRLAALAHGPITDDGRFSTEPFVETGRIACLACNNIRLVLTERAVLGPQPSLFGKVGIDSFRAKVVALKTGVGYKTTYGHVAREVIRVDCPGASSYDLSRFDYRLAPRPLAPLDKNVLWPTNPIRQTI